MQNLSVLFSFPLSFFPSFTRLFPLSWLKAITLIRAVEDVNFGEWWWCYAAGPKGRCVINEDLLSPDHTATTTRTAVDAKRRRSLPENIETLEEREKRKLCFNNRDRTSQDSLSQEPSLLLLHFGRLGGTVFSRQRIEKEKESERERSCVDGLSPEITLPFSFLLLGFQPSQWLTLMSFFDCGLSLCGAERKNSFFDFLIKKPRAFWLFAAQHYNLVVHTNKGWNLDLNVPLLLRSEALFSSRQSEKMRVSSRWGRRRRRAIKDLHETTKKKAGNDAFSEKSVPFGRGISSCLKQLFEVVFLLPFRPILRLRKKSCWRKCRARMIHLSFSSLSPFSPSFIRSEEEPNGGKRGAKVYLRIGCYDDQKLSKLFVGSSISDYFCGVTTQLKWNLLCSSGDSWCITPPSSHAWSSSSVETSCVNVLWCFAFFPSSAVKKISVCVRWRMTSPHFQYGTQRRRRTKRQEKNQKKKEDKSALDSTLWQLRIKVCTCFVAGKTETNWRVFL